MYAYMQVPIGHDMPVDGRVTCASAHFLLSLEGARPLALRRD